MAVSKTGTGQWNAKGLGTEGWENKVTFSVCSFLLICADVELLYDVEVDSSLCCVDPCVLGPFGGVEFCQYHQMHRYNS